MRKAQQRRKQSGAMEKEKTGMEVRKHGQYLIIWSGIDSNGEDGKSGRLF